MRRELGNVLSDIGDLGVHVQKNLTLVRSVAFNTYARGSRRSSMSALTLISVIVLLRFDFAV
jgi:hypothetical protein